MNIFINKILKSAGMLALFLATLFMCLELPEKAMAAQRPGVLEAYEARVKMRVERNLELPRQHTRNNRGNPYSAMARIELDPRGYVTGVTITQPSGNRAFDNAVIRAIRKTGTFGPPPFQGLRVVGLRFSAK